MVIPTKWMYMHNNQGLKAILNYLYLNMTSTIGEFTYAKY